MEFTGILTRCFSWWWLTTNWQNVSNLVQRLDECFWHLVSPGSSSCYLDFSRQWSRYGNLARDGRCGGFRYARGAQCDITQHFLAILLHGGLCTWQRSSYFTWLWDNRWGLPRLMYSDGIYQCISPCNNSRPFTVHYMMISTYEAVHINTEWYDSIIDILIMMWHVHVVWHIYIYILFYFICCISSLKCCISQSFSVRGPACMCQISVQATIWTAQYLGLKNPNPSHPSSHGRFWKSWGPSQDYGAFSVAKYLCSSRGLWQCALLGATAVGCGTARILWRTCTDLRMSWEACWSVKFVSYIRPYQVVEIGLRWKLSGSSWRNWMRRPWIYPLHRSCFRNVDVEVVATPTMSGAARHRRWQFGSWAAPFSC